VALEGTAVDAVSSFEENLMGYPDAYRALTFDKMVDRTVEKVASLPDDAKVVLVGHSWGCMPMTMAAEKCPPERLAFIVYLSGPCPSDGQSAFDLGNEWFATPASEGGGAELITEVMDKGKFWEDHYPEDDLRSPSGLRVKRSPSDKTDEKLQFVRRVGQAEFYCDLSEMERVRKALYGCCPERVSAEMLARMRPMPLANFSVRVALTERFESIPRAYVKCLRDESMHPAYREFIVKRRGFGRGAMLCMSWTRTTRRRCRTPSSWRPCWPTWPRDGRGRGSFRSRQTDGGRYACWHGVVWVSVCLSGVCKWQGVNAFASIEGAWIRDCLYGAGG